ncbi:MAG: decaprenyl-phosphate phosphoribosyltransferase [Alphaproteobacteria bacterium]|jgi:4-hydroxybenzoate polyprenyltransferase|nr:decaprenyl-phosphate phosphoribosyltransferase [Alphaproteobacteria bacterium]
MAAYEERSEPPGEPAAAPAGGPLGRLRCYVRLLRVRQWVKNGFVVMPLLLTPGTLSAASATSVAIAFLCFCAAASAGYIINDYADREADRRHPEKRHRPLASGAVGVAEAVALLVCLLVAALAGAIWLSPTIFTIILGYVVLNLAYSFALKHVAILDIIIIAAGFVFRVKAGAEAIQVRPSVWIIVCTGLLALFLAVAKRRDDLVRDLDGEHRRSLDGYNKPFVDVAIGILLAATFVSYVIYTTDAQVMARLGTERLYLTIPFVLAGILRYLQITLVEERSGSPTTILLRDPFTASVVLGWLACLALLVHF